MTLALSDLELYFLKEDETLQTGTWSEYQNGLSFVKWNRRISYNIDTAGDLIASADPDSINSTNGYSLRFLKGLYNIGNINSPYLTKQYIIDNNDPLLIGNHPLWQFTVIAVQNNSGADTCYRFGMDVGYYYSGQFTGTGNPADFTSGATEYFGIRWLGLVDNANFTIAYLDGATGEFPLWFVVEQPDTDFNIWNAIGDSAYARNSLTEKIYHGMNNSQSYEIETTYKPWQVARWIATMDYQNNVSGRREHCFDIAPGKTLIGIMVATRDSKAIQQDNALEDNSVSISAVSTYGWKISEVNARFQRLVI